jgi:hypothetical protein
MEFLATGMKLHGGAMGAIVIASQAVRKGGNHPAGEFSSPFVFNI